MNPALIPQLGVPYVPMPQPIQQSQISTSPFTSNSPFTSYTASPFTTTNTALQGQSIPDITQNHIYQALLGLSPQSLGGEGAAQQIQQAGQQSQRPRAGGFGGFLGGALTGGLIGAGVGGPIGALVGALGGGALGAFTPIMETPQNAVIQSIKDIEDNNSGNILPDIGKQLLAQAPAPNYAQVLNKINPLPNVSPFGNTFLLGGLTNPHELANIGLNVATNPFSFIPVNGGVGLAKLGEQEIANAGLQDAVRGVTGSVDNAFLTKAGGNLRNELAQPLGFNNYAELTNAARLNPEIMQPFNQAFNQAITQNPERYINNVGLKLQIPFTPAEIPLPVSAKALNGIASNPLIAGANDNLQSLGNIGGQLIGKLLPFRQMATEFSPDIAQGVENIAQSNLAQANEARRVLSDEAMNLAQSATPEQLQAARNVIEGYPKEGAQVNPDTLQGLENLRNQISEVGQRTAANAGVELPFESENYFSKVLQNQQAQPRNAVEAAMQKLFNIDPLLARGGKEAPQLPGQLANINKNTVLGKFIDQATGEKLIGSPSELGLKPANVDSVTGEVDRFKEPIEVPGLSGKFIGAYKGQDGGLYFEKYLPTGEANDYLKDKTNFQYEENPLVAALTAHRNATRVEAFQNTINQLKRLTDADGNPLIYPAQLGKNGKPLKTQIDEKLETLGKGQLNGYVVPKSIQNYLKATFTRDERETVDAAQIANKMGNVTRRLMIANPLFHLTHNVLFNSALSGLSPTKILTNIAKGFMPGFTEKLMETPEVQQYIKAGGEVSGLKDSLSQGTGIIDRIAKTTPDAGGLGQRGINLLKSINNYLVDTVQSAELGTRADMYKMFTNQGMGADQARRSVEEYMFRNGSQTQFEKTYLSGLFTFYNWMKNNTLLWGQHPNATAALNSILDGINENTSEHQMALNPAGKQNKLYIGNWGGQDHYVDLKLPFKDINTLSQNPVQFLQNKLNPMVSTVGELLLNKDYLGNQIVNPNLPISLQQQKVLGMNMDPRLALALQNLLPPLQGASKAQQLLTPQGFGSTILGTPLSSQKPNTQALQEYMAQKATMDALAQYAQNHNAQGGKVSTNAPNALLTSQQANPYNTSPSTQNYIAKLQTNMNNLSDRAYGFHYNAQGQKVMATGANAQKHQASLARSRALRMAKRSASRSKIHLPKRKTFSFHTSHPKLRLKA